MCQSKVNGGRRCVAVGYSNYPDKLKVDASKKNIAFYGDITAQPELFLHAAVIAARSGLPVSPELASLAKEQGKSFSQLTKTELWRHWQDIALAENPSAALQALYDMNWETHFPALANIRGVVQSSVWHPEGSVDVHTAQAADVAAKNALAEGLSKEDTTVAVLGAICHDFGKSTNTQIDAKTGAITSQGHEVAGQPIAHDFLQSIGANENALRQIPLIVRQHMHHAHAPTMSSVRRLIATLNNNGKGTTLEMWARVAEADTGGRGSASRHGISKEWLEMKKAIEIHAEQSKNIIVTGRYLMNTLQLTDRNQYSAIINGARKAQLAGEFVTEPAARTWLKDNFNL